VALIKGSTIHAPAEKKKKPALSVPHPHQAGSPAATLTQRRTDLNSALKAASAQLKAQIAAAKTPQEKLQVYLTALNVQDKAKARIDSFNRDLNAEMEKAGVRQQTALQDANQKALEEQRNALGPPTPEGLFSEPTSSTAKALAPLQPVLPGQSPAFAATPIDARIQNMVTGYWAATGRLPAPKKIQDSLQASTGNETAAQWATRFRKLLSSPEFSGETQTQAASGDSIYEGDPRKEIPVLDKIAFTLLPTGAFMLPNWTSWKKEKEQANTVYPMIRPLEALLAEATPHSRAQIGQARALMNGRLQFLDARGFSPRIGTGNEFTLAPGASLEDQYADSMKQYVFAANLPDAVWKLDPKATEQVWASGQLPAGYDPRMALYRIKGGDEDAIKSLIFFGGMKARDPRMTEGEYVKWYARRFGSDKLPQAYATELDQENAWGAFGHAAAIAGDIFGYTLFKKGVTEVAARLEGNRQVAVIPWGATPQPAPKLSTRILSAQEAASPLLARLENDPLIVRGELAGAEAMKIANAPIMTANRLLVTSQYVLGDKDSFKGFSNLMENTQDAWDAAAGKVPMAEFMRAANIDPAKHTTIAWAGETLIEGVEGWGADKLIQMATKGLYGSRFGESLLREGGILDHSQIMADMGRLDPAEVARLGEKEKEAYILQQHELGAAGIRHLYGWIDPQDAVHIADELDTPEKVAAFWEARGTTGLKDLDKQLGSPSIATTRAYKRLTDETVSPNSRRLFAHVGDSPWDLSHDADFRAYNAAIHAGWSEREALQAMGRVTRAMAEAGAEEGTKNAAWTAAHDLELAIVEGWKKKPASEEFMAYAKTTSATEWDERRQYQAEYFGQKEPGSGGLPVNKFSPNVVTGEEMSLAVDPAMRAGFAKTMHDIGEEAAKHKAAIKELKAQSTKAGIGSEAAKLQAQIKVHELELAKLAKKRSDIKGMWGALTKENAPKGVPMTEGQFPNEYHPQLYSETAQAAFSAGPRFRKWALTNTTWRLEAFNRLYKTLILFKLSTMLTIVGADEYIRSVIEGVNPFAILGLKEYMTPAIREAVDSSPLMREQISGVLRDLKRETYIDIAPGDPRHERACKFFLGNFNAGKAGQKVVRDWWNLFEDETRALGARDPYMANKAIVDEAARRANRSFRELVYTDPYYQGTADTKGFLAQTHRVPTEYEQKAFAGGKQFDVTDDWINSLSERATAMVANKTTMRHLREGPKGWRKGDLTDAVARIYGHVQFEDSTYITRMGKELGVSPDLIRQLIHRLPRPDGALFGVLDRLSTRLKGQTFAKIYRDKQAYLRKYGKGLSEEEINGRAARLAHQRTMTLSYSGQRALFEEGFRNVLMFLPAYRQFARFWLPWIAKNPYKARILVNSLPNMPDQNVPEGVPIIGGRTAWSGKYISFFTGLQPGSEDFNIPHPPFSGVVSVPLEMLDILGVVPHGTSKTVSGGYEPGTPFTTMRWLESIGYGITGELNPGLQDVVFNKVGGYFPAEAQLSRGRRNAAVGNLVVQAIKSKGTTIDPAAAEATINKVEIARGITNWAVPGNLHRVMPTVQVVDGDLGGLATIDLAKMYQAQAEYLSEPTPEGRAAILASYKPYEIAARAYELSGDEQLAYLSQHYWVIPFVVRKRDQRADIDPASQLAEIAATPLSAAESLATREPMTVADYAHLLRQKYQEVDKWRLQQVYAKEVDKALKADAKAAFAKDKLHGAGRLTRTQWYKDWYANPVWQDGKPVTHAAELIDQFAAKHHDELVRALKQPNSPEAAIFVTKAGAKEPTWVSSMRLSTSYLDDNTYETLKDFSQSTLAYAHEVVQNSPFYEQFQQKLADEHTQKIKAGVEAATAKYKADLTPEQWDALGVHIDPQDVQAVHDAAVRTDYWMKRLHATAAKYGFGTDQYKKVYAAMDADLDKFKIGSEARDILAASTGDLLRRVGLDKPAPIVESGHTLNPNGKRALLAYQKALRIINGDDATVEKAKQAYLKLKPDKQAQIDEYLRAGAWGAFLKKGDLYREALGTELSYESVRTSSSGHKYTVTVKAWGRGFSVGSTEGKKFTQTLNNYFKTYSDIVRGVTGKDLMGDDVREYFPTYETPGYFLLYW
jgi:hypothetical protein